MPSPKAKPTSPRRRHNRADVGLNSMDLVPRRAEFVRQYLLDLNARRAAIRAGFSEESAKKASVQLLRDEWVREEIRDAMAARAARTELSADRVLKELAAIAYVDIRDLMSWTGTQITLKDSSILRAEDAAAVAGLKPHFSPTTGDCTVEMKLHDKVAALRLLGQHFGLWGRLVAPGDGAGAQADVVSEMASDGDPDVRPEDGAA